VTNTITQLCLKVFFATKKHENRKIDFAAFELFVAKIWMVLRI